MNTLPRRTLLSAAALLVSRLRRLPPSAARGGTTPCPAQVRAWRSLAWPAPRPAESLAALPGLAPSPAGGRAGVRASRVS